MADQSAQVAAAGLIEELAAEDLIEADEATADAVEQPAEEVADEVEIPEITTGIPDDLEELFSGPDDFEDDEVVPVAETEYEVNEYDDEDKQKMAKQLNKLNKQLAWERSQKVKASQKGWAQEATKYFQFSNPEVIQADSRRSFLKQAKAQHDAVAKVAKPIFDQLKTERSKMKEEAMAEARAEAEKRWGRPPSGTGAHTPAAQTTQSVARERLNQGNSLKDVILNKMRQGEVNI